MSERIEKLLEEILDQLREQNKFLRALPGEGEVTEATCLAMIHEELVKIREMNEEARRMVLPAKPTGKPVPVPPWMEFKPYDPTEELVRLCKARDAFKEQLDGMEQMAAAFEETGKGDPFAKMLRAQIQASGIPSQLERIEEQVSQVQRQIEQMETVPADGAEAAQAASPEAK